MLRFVLSLNLVCSDRIWKTFQICNNKHILETFCFDETALLQNHICSKRLQLGTKQVLRYSCLWDPTHTVRAVIKFGHIFWAPCSWEELRALLIKVCCSAVPCVSAQCLAPERNLRCQIKYLSFLGSAWVSRWHDTGEMPVLPSRKCWRKESTGEQPLSQAQRDGLRNSSPSHWTEMAQS